MAGKYMAAGEYPLQPAECEVLVALYPVSKCNNPGIFRFGDLDSVHSYRMFS